MCLAIPALIQQIEGIEGVVEIGGVQRKVSLVLTPDAKVGQYALIHAGYTIGVLDEKEAQETLKLLEEIAATADETSPPGEADPI